MIKWKTIVKDYLVLTKQRGETMFDISKFNEYREDDKLEIKKAKGGLPLSLWETYSLFANTNGGVIILGIAENKDGSFRLTGLEDDAKLQKDFWNTINNRRKVSINLLKEEDIEVYREPDGIIIVIYVPRAERDNKPVYINDDMFSGTFRRNWEGDYKCTTDEVKAMLRDQPEATSDMKVLDEFSMEDLDYETIHGYRNRHMVFKPGHPWEKYDDDKYLKMICTAAVSKADGLSHPTAAGLLMFGQEYIGLTEKQIPN